VRLSLASSTATTGLIGSDVNRIGLGTFFRTRVAIIGTGIALGVDKDVIHTELSILIVVS
jgi:hypothetical protein